MAVICGTPTPETTRVVQIEPGPIPTFTASAPASIRARGALGGRHVAGDHLDVELPLDPPDRLDHVLAVAVGRVDDQHVDVGFEQRGDPLVVVDPDRRPDPQPPAGVLAGVRDSGAACRCP